MTARDGLYDRRLAGASLPRDRLYDCRPAAIRPPSGGYSTAVRRGLRPLSGRAYLVFSETSDLSAEVACWTSE
jgi:hypothetical protein